MSSDAAGPETQSTGPVAEDAPVEAKVAGGPAHNLRYRPDIDGLRAIAVGSVVLFHLGTGLVPGGFAGVDVFFVISGYLITGAIHREIVDGTFTIGGFYERRIRRIFPALIAVLALVAVAGLIIQFPDDLRDLGASLLAAATFSSNILFWVTTDYFAAPAESKPLLHTWSLAVEEQFYIVVPLLMALLHRVAPRRLGPVMLVLTVLSFAASCAWVWIDQSGNYYLPHTRAWELLFGSLVALGVIPAASRASVNEAIAAIGFVLLMVPFFILDGESIFPAWNALATCLGTALLIRTGEGRQTMVASFLGNRLFVGIGLISYSLYLVHWPIIVFARYLLLREPTGLETAGLAFLMIVAATVSWRFVERPFRNRRAMSNRLVVTIGIGGSALVAACGAAFFMLHGLPQRLTAEERQLAREAPEQPQPFRCFMQGSWQEWQGERCFLTRGSGPVVLLWGDSHANHFSRVLRDMSANARSNILFYGSAGCPPVLNANPPSRPHCSGNNQHVLDVIRQFGVTRVVLSAYWERTMTGFGISLDDLRQTIDQLRAMGVDVRIIGDNPDFPFNNPRYLAMRLASRTDPSAPYYTGVRNTPGFNRGLESLVGADRFFDPMAPLCHADECLAFENGQLLMTDNAHFSSYGATRTLNAGALALFQ